MKRAALVFFVQFLLLILLLGIGGCKCCGDSKPKPGCRGKCETAKEELITKLARTRLLGSLYCVCVPTKNGKFCTAIVSNGSWEQMFQLMGPDGNPLECVVPRERR